MLVCILSVSAMCSGMLTPRLDVALLSTKLLVLRQAACHPQLGSRGIGGTSRRWKAVSAGPRDYQVTNKGIQVNRCLPGREDGMAVCVSPSVNLSICLTACLTEALFSCPVLCSVNR